MSRTGGLAPTTVSIMDEICNLEHLNAVKGFKTVHLNVRSLTKKIDQLRMLLYQSRIDILTISETWLRPHMRSDIYALDNFTSYRLDRANRKGKCKRGGGLITYINNAHASISESLEDLNESGENIEAQWVLVHRPHCKNIVVCNIYRPPNGDLKAALKCLDECLKTINLSKVNVFIVGDLNVNYKNKSSANFKKLHFFAQSNGMSQHIENTTRNTDQTNSLIDLALTNSKFVSHAGTLEHFISDHQPIYIVHKKGKDVRESVKFTGRSYRDFDKQTFKDKLLDKDWGGYYDISDPSTAWSYIKNRVEQVLDEMCPLKTFHIKNYRPDWMTDELIEQIKDRDYFYRKAKSTGDEDAWNIAKYLRNTTNSNIRQAKRDFVLDELRQNERNPKKFWKVIRDVIPADKSSTHLDILLKDAGSKIDKGKVAHFINEYFVNVGKVELPTSQTDSQNDPLDDNSMLEGGEATMCLERVNEIEVSRVIREINVSKSSGLENIGSFIVKQLFEILITKVTYMFNLSIERSSFPREWKLALVIPIPKTGDLTKVKNYRPISLLPLPGKILEKLVHKQLSDYLEGESLLMEEQHGFRKNHSTTHSVAQLANYVNLKMDQGMCTLATYIDFRKAFDCVQHGVLVDKLYRLKLDRTTIEWVISY